MRNVTINLKTSLVNAEVNFKDLLALPSDNFLIKNLDTPIYVSLRRVMYLIQEYWYLKWTK